MLPTPTTKNKTPEMQDKLSKKASPITDALNTQTKQTERQYSAFNTPLLLSDTISTLTTPWSSRTHLHKLYTVALIAILIGITQMPYAYYILLRIILFTSTIMFCMELLKSKTPHTLTFLLCASLAILYNPFVPIQLGEKALWTIINLGTLYILYRTRLSLNEITPPQENQDNNQNKDETPQP